LSEAPVITPTENVGFTVPNGPFIVTGDLQIDLGEAGVVTQPRASLCRCGASAKKPFCDGSHRTSGFTDPGEATPADPIGDAGGPGTLSCFLIPNGPLIANGPLVVQNAQKTTIANTVEMALCRCGASANKPYCDGSHNTVGFIG
jgi:CDGSH-type Zn-finger protein